VYYRCVSVHRCMSVDRCVSVQRCMSVHRCESVHRCVSVSGVRVHVCECTQVCEWTEKFMNGFTSV
jgi:hypothetical protein